MGLNKRRSNPCRTVSIMDNYDLVVVRMEFGYINGLGIAFVKVFLEPDYDRRWANKERNGLRELEFGYND